MTWSSSRRRRCFGEGCGWGLRMGAADLGIAWWVLAGTAGNIWQLAASVCRLQGRVDLFAVALLLLRPAEPAAACCVATRPPCRRRRLH